MRDEPAELPVDVVLDAVRRGWGLPVDRVHYAPVGQGSYNWVAEVEGAARWFVKGDGVGSDEDFERLRSCFVTAAALREQGLEFVVAPLPDLAGEPIRRVASGWAMSVCQHLSGTEAGDGPWRCDSHRAAIGSLMGRLHAAQVPAQAPRWPWPGEALPRSVHTLIPGLDRLWSSGPFAGEVQEMLLDAAPLLQRLLDHFHALMARLDADPAPWVVTHGEPHSANVILTGTDQMHLIDWDSARVAPREREFRRYLVLEGDTMKAYAAASGTDVIRPYVVELFKAEWDLVDTKWHASRIRKPHAETADARHALAALRAYLDIAQHWPVLA